MMIVETIKAENAGAVFRVKIRNPCFPARTTSVVIDAMNSSDETLAREIQAGRKNLLALVIRRHSDRLFGIILRLVQNRSAAEDILQDTWIRVLQKIHQFDPSFPLAAWLTTIALNLCRDHWRREWIRRIWKRRDPQGNDERLEDIPAVDAKDSLDVKIDVSKALNKISPKLREVVVLKFFSGLTLDDIAGILDIPEGTVKSRLHFALSKLREHLDEKGRRS